VHFVYKIRFVTSVKQTSVALRLESHCRLLEGRHITHRHLYYNNPFRRHMITQNVTEWCITRNALKHVKVWQTQSKMRKSLYWLEWHCSPVHTTVYVRSPTVPKFSPFTEPAPNESSASSLLQLQTLFQLCIYDNSSRLLLFLSDDWNLTFLKRLLIPNHLLTSCNTLLSRLFTVINRF